MSYPELQAAAAAVAAQTGRDRHRVGAVLGSGLSAYATSREGATEVAYDRIPGFPAPKVEGHAGSVFSVDMDGVPVLLLAGRVHTYEGWAMDEVVFGVRCAVMSGCTTVLLTNAAGGIGAHLAPGDLVTISDHINLTGRNPLAGPNDDRIGPRFPDLTDLYSQELRRVAQAVAAGLDVELKEGVYAWLLGPSYETPAEIRMLERLGADLVGMSTVPEAIAVRHMGARVLGISLVTNLAAGISATPLSHEEVQETAAATRERFSRLLDHLLPRLAEEG